MNRRSTEEHRAAVDALLAPLFENRVSELLEVSPQRLAEHSGEFRARVLASDLLSPTDLPNFDNSQMDGYAVSWFDLVTASPENPVELLVAAQIAAGDGAEPLASGTAAPIMTGAPVPPGADAIVPIEQAIPPRFAAIASSETAEETPEASGATSDTPVAASAPATVSFIEPVTPGTFIRRTGSDVRAGAVLLPAGSPLGPAQLGVIAGTGLTVIDVVRRIRVLLVSTGHEIREPGTTLGAGQIFDANSVSLSVALIEAGCEVTAVPCRSDDAVDLLGILAAHASAHDLIITVGGVSAGAREVVRDALGPLGVEFGTVAMQPGGPQGFGRATLDDVVRPVLSLPGNPVSALVSFEMFVRPALRRLAQSEPADRMREVAMIIGATDSPPGVYQVRRGFVHDDGTVELVGGPSSHLLHSYASSNALVHIPADVEHLDAGDPVMVWRIDE
ncbi:MULTISPECIES: gephyrin-like molybdotransferase Glp [Subtercola]|uniref:molybdopterin molybdotransferase MoeA n=1 Tax=Subtercola TaxID=120212 RepID=UPI001F33B0FD|nr:MULTISPECIES: gephyrin-like molybdotransferase Glp [Subtercola]MEA9987091.1 molybdopterin molybdotransferase MoeA [Subtercola sp. RTI3]